MDERRFNVGMICVNRWQDPGISNMYPGKYAPFDSGLEEGVFIRNASGSPLVGQVDTFISVTISPLFITLWDFSR